MTHELVELTRLGESAAKLPASQNALSSEEDEDRGHDRQVREQRVDVAEDALALSLGDHGTGLDSIALIHAQIDDAATDFGSGVDLGRLDVSGDAQSIAGWSRRARHPKGRHSEHEQT